MITLEQAKQHLRVTHDEEDALIASYIAAAEDYCRAFLGYDPVEEYETIPGTIIAGLLVHVAILYEAREGEDAPKNLKTVDLLYWPHKRVRV